MEEARSFSSGFSKNWERSYLACRAVRAVRAAFHSHPWSRHAMWTSPRSRARFNRACVRRALASLSMAAMLFLQRGGTNPAGRPPSSMAWSRALRAADSDSAAFHRLVLTATSAAACVSSTKQWLLISIFYGQMRLSDCWQILVRLRVWVRIYHLVPRRYQRARLLQTA